MLKIKHFETEIYNLTTKCTKKIGNKIIVVESRKNNKEQNHIRNEN